MREGELKRLSRIGVEWKEKKKDFQFNSLVLRVDDVDWLIENKEKFERMKIDFSEDIDFKRREILELHERIKELDRVIELKEFNCELMCEKNFELEIENRLLRQALNEKGGK